MNQANLLLHCGSSRVDYEHVKAVTTPAPVDRWRPIAHQQLVEDVSENLGTVNLEIVNEAHGLTKEGDRYFGLFHVQPTNRAIHPDHAMIMGLRNSHDKSFPAGIAVGSQVFVCDNLCFSGEITLMRRHTTNIIRDLPNIISKAVGMMSQKWVHDEERFSAYRETEISDANAHDIVIRALDNRSINTTMVPKVLKEWRRPQHEEFTPRTLWSLYNAFTERFKGYNPDRIRQNGIKLTGLFDNEIGLTFNGAETAVPELAEEPRNPYHGLA